MVISYPDCGSCLSRMRNKIILYLSGIYVHFWTSGCRYVPTDHKRPQRGSQYVTPFSNFGTPCKPLEQAKLCSSNSVHKLTYSSFFSRKNSPPNGHGWVDVNRDASTAANITRMALSRAHTTAEAQQSPLITIKHTPDKTPSVTGYDSTLI